MVKEGKITQEQADKLKKAIADFQEKQAKERQKFMKGLPGKTGISESTLRGTDGTAPFPSRTGTAVAAGTTGNPDRSSSDTGKKQNNDVEKSGITSYWRFLIFLICLVILYPGRDSVCSYEAADGMLFQGWYDFRNYRKDCCFYKIVFLIFQLFHQRM